MSGVKKILKTLIRIVLKVRARKQISHLRGISNQATDKIANALFDTLNNHVTSEEKTWVDRIEALRKTLESSSSKITITDYGAGTANSSRTKEEMYQGIITIRTVGEACQASKPYFWSLLLFKLIRRFKPLNSLELGTCLGISGAYLASAQKLNKKGRLVTLEGSESLASIAEQNFQTLALDNVSIVIGRFQDTLDNVLNEYKPIDYAFIDGHHDEQATLAYFEQIQSYLSDKSILIFDDISWSKGMCRAWKKIKENKKIKISLDLRVIGICVIDNDIDQKHSFKIPLL